MTILPAEGAPSRPDRPSTRLLHDEPNVRVVSFHLLPGQAVPRHRSDSTVILQVVEGEGVFRGGDGEGARVAAGGTMVFAAGEDHAIEATDAPLRFLALIAPRPG